MTRVRFRSTDSDNTVEGEGGMGETLLAVAQANGLPLEGTCEGQMACSTCHVVVDAADYEKLPPPSEEEQDLLDLAAHVTRYSRLGCQILLGGELDEITVRLPAGVHNMQGR